MPFYMFNIENPKEGYVDFYLRHFHSEVEKDSFIKSCLKQGDKVSFLKSDTLLSIITHKNFEINQNSGTKEDILDIVREFKEEFGELVSTEFPNEKVNADFIQNVIEECDDILLEIMTEEFGHAKRNNPPLHHNDWSESSQDETQKWDNETDGSWREANDFG